LKLEKRFEEMNKFYFNKFLNKDLIYCQNIISCLNRIHNRLGKTFVCSAGKETLAVLPNGDILPCQNFQCYLETISGNVNDSFFEGSFSALHINELPQCQTCWVKYLCGGGCYYEKYVEHQNITDPVASKCKLTQLQWLYMLKLYVSLEKHGIFVNLNDVSKGVMRDINRI
jgi:uncharacterized protein